MNTKRRAVVALTSTACLVVAAACSGAMDGGERVHVTELALNESPPIVASIRGAAVLGARLTPQTGRGALALDTLALSVSGATDAVTTAHLWLDVNKNGRIDADGDIHLSATPVTDDGRCDLTGLDLALDVDVDLLVAIDMADDCAPGDEVAIEIDVESSVVVDVDAGVEVELDGSHIGSAVTVGVDADACVEVGVTASVESAIAVGIGDEQETLALSLGAEADVQVSTLAFAVEGDVATGLTADLILDVDGDGLYTDVDEVLAAGAELSVDGCTFDGLDLDLRAGVDADVLVVIHTNDRCLPGDALSLRLDLDASVFVARDGRGCCVDGAAACVVTMVDVGVGGCVDGACDDEPGDCGECNGTLQITASSSLDLASSNVLALDLGTDVDVRLDTLALAAIGSVNDSAVTADLWLDVNGNGRIDVDVDVALDLDVPFNGDDGICSFDDLGLWIEAGAHAQVLVAVNLEAAIVGQTFGIIIGSDQCSASGAGTDVDIDVSIDTGLCLIGGL